MSYRETLDPKVIQRIRDGAFIPRDEGNRDYQEFLEFEKGGGRIQPPVIDPPDPKEVERQQAIQDLKNGTKTDSERFAALIKVLGLG